MPYKKQFSGDNAREDSQGVDNSLRGNALRRAVLQQVPRTLTPHEWEQWYIEHGVPQEHRETDRRPKSRWATFFNWF